MSTYGGGYGLGSAYRIAPSISQTRTFNLTQPVRYSPPGAAYTGVTLPFSETWTGADGSVWPAVWAHNTIAGSTIQSNTGQITAGPGAGYDGALSRLAWIPNIVDTEVLVDVTAVSVGVEQYPQVALRTGPDSSATRPAVGYSLFLCYAATPSSSFLQIERQPGGTILGTPAFTLTGGVTYRVRFRAVGADLSVKVWDASTTEPGTWTWTLTDSTPYLTAGSVTLGQGNGADGVARSARFDNPTVSVATNAVAGAGAVTATPATISGAGTLRVTGAGTPTATPATLTAAGTLTLTGTGGLSTPPATLSAAGTSTLTGASALAPTPATLTGSGVVTEPDVVGGTGDLTAPAAGLGGTGTLKVTGAGQLNAQATTAAATALLTLAGTGGLGAAPAGLVGSGSITVTGDGLLTPPPAVLDGAGTVVDPTAPVIYAGPLETLTVGVELRVATVSAELRTLEVGGDSRRVQVTADQRTDTVPAAQHSLVSA